MKIYIAYMEKIEEIGGLRKIKVNGLKFKTG